MKIIWVAVVFFVAVSVSVWAVSDEFITGNSMSLRNQMTMGEIAAAGGGDSVLWDATNDVVLWDATGDKVLWE